MLQHVCWHLGSEHVPRKMELPIQCRNVSFTEYIADCARRLFINRLTLCSSSKELSSLFLSREPFLSCLEPAPCLLVSFVCSANDIQTEKPTSFSCFLPTSSLKCLDVRFQIREG